APFNTAGTCSYEVFAWWTANTNRGTAVSFTVAGHQAGSTGKTVNQQTNGGKWNSLGIYTWNASTQGQVTVSGPNSPQASADAVRFALVATTTTSTTTAT